MKRDLSSEAVKLSEGIISVKRDQFSEASFRIQLSTSNLKRAIAPTAFKLSIFQAVQLFNQYSGGDYWIQQLDNLDQIKHPSNKWYILCNPNIDSLFNNNSI